MWLLKSYWKTSWVLQHNAVSCIPVFIKTWCALQIRGCKVFALKIGKLELIQWWQDVLTTPYFSWVRQCLLAGHWTAGLCLQVVRGTSTNVQFPAGTVSVSPMLHAFGLAFSYDSVSEDLLAWAGSLEKIGAVSFTGMTWFLRTTMHPSEVKCATLYCKIHIFQVSKATRKEISWRHLY